MCPTTKITQVDAFTTEPFGGNPAAVCVLDRPRDAGWMQAVALEMNLSETAFLVPRDDGYELRWFTPALEVDLCGHATLASAHVLWEEGHLGPDDEAIFHTRSGRLGARREDGWIVLDFPALVPQPVTPPDGLAAALGAEPVWVGAVTTFFLVELESEAVVRGLAPDFRALACFDDRRSIVTAGGEAAESRSPIVTARGDGDVDFVSRFFAPVAGIDEDPVTGSAHCVLCPYWVQKLGRNPLLGYQASSRGGVVRVELRGDRVELGGKAVTTLRGELMV
ncbi:MAG: PhzF family phenazine biosynthesis protein [Thermoanaerobaculia bacterium]|nr:PhzF family phenazine biosynthesis protein [Thermoanaerobaculia bacterium]